LKPRVASTRASSHAASEGYDVTEPGAASGAMRFGALPAAELQERRPGGVPFDGMQRIRLAREWLHTAIGLEVAPMVGVMLVATLVRVWGINNFGYNTDEAVYAGQAAAIAQDADLKEIFPIFRAHPLLFQFVLALSFSFGVNDVVGRLIAVAVGLATVLLVYRLGADLYGRRCGLLAALFVAVMPYHVIVTRQVLLDGPMALCATAALFAVARFAITQRPAWLYAAGAAMGLTFLAKETGVVLISAIYGFLALTPEIRLRLRDIVFSLVALALVIAPFPLSLYLAGGGGSQRAQQYLVWQLFRRPNHTWDFYPLTVMPAFGLLLLAVAVVGLLLLRRHNGWREKLLLLWILVPFIFFQLWPVKGFQYLLPMSPPIAILGARAVAAWRPGWIQGFGWEFRVSWLQPVVVAVVTISLLLPSWGAVQARAGTEFLAGTGGVPGGREAGDWVRDNTPEGARLMTIGPSMANIIQFYGHRRAYGLAVSPNPLHRNPSYDPLTNPDLLIRNNDLQYIVWDSFSAARSPFFSDGVMRYVRRYNGRAVHTELVTVTTPSGRTTEEPLIVIYEVRP